jgi:hypothetical protein
VRNAFRILRRRPMLVGNPGQRAIGIGHPICSGMVPMRMVVEPAHNPEFDAGRALVAPGLTGWLEHYARFRAMVVCAVRAATRLTAEEASRGDRSIESCGSPLPSQMPFFGGISASGRLQFGVGKSTPKPSGNFVEERRPRPGVSSRAINGRHADRFRLTRAFALVAATR